MSKQMQDAYIVAATRTPIGKAPRGMFKNVRPDDLLVREGEQGVCRVICYSPDHSLTLSRMTPDQIERVKAASARTRTARIREVQS